MIKRWGDVFSSTGTVVLSLLSCMGCPLCLPLYAGLLNIVGIELIDTHEFLFPIMSAFGLLTLGFMAYQIHTHQGSWIAFKLATGAVLGMLTSAFFGFDYSLYAFLAAFMGCVFWNKKLLMHKGNKCC